MSDTGDHVPEMSTTPLLDDLAIEAILDGDAVPAELGGLAAFAAGVRATGDRPTPRPSPALARLLAAGGGAAAPAAAAAGATERRPTGRRLVLAKVAGLSIVAKLGIGATAATAGVIGAGAGGLLPGQVGRVVRDAIEVITPVEFTDGDHSPGTDPSEPTGGDHGDRVSSDATGESDGEPGVDGSEISQDAPGASVRPSEPPGQAGTPGPPADPGTPPVARPHGEPGRPADPRPPADPGAPPSTLPTPPSTSPPHPITAGGSSDPQQSSTATQDQASASAGPHSPAP